MELLIKMSLTFYKVSTVLPKKNNVYWCIVKCLNLAAKTTEYHYAFVEFEIDDCCLVEWEGKFKAPVMEGFEFEVMAWCELEDPEKYFKEKRLIIA